MEIERILRLMENAGFRILGTDSQYIYIEEPSCILRGFVSFAEYAWIALVCVTGLLLFGWAISMIRGSKNDIFINLRNLILIFGIMSAMGPIINFVFGDDLFKRGCKTEKVSIPDVQELLATRNAKLSPRDENELYENIAIHDSGAIISDLTPEPDSMSEPAPETKPKAVPKTALHITAPEPESAPHGNGELRAIKAHGDGTHTIYTYSDQSKTRREKGTPAWRNNNPGNIVAGRFITRAGGIGKSGRFGVFPDEQTGMDAIVKLLKTDTYQNKTLAGAINAWAPPHENNTASYQQQVSHATGVQLNTPMRNLNDNQLREIAKIIRRIEGWRPGQEKRE